MCPLKYTCIYRRTKNNEPKLEVERGKREKGERFGAQVVERQIYSEVPGPSVTIRDQRWRRDSACWRRQEVRAPLLVLLGIAERR